MADPLGAAAPGRSISRVRRRRPCTTASGAAGTPCSPTVGQRQCARRQVGFDGEARLTWLDWRVDGAKPVLSGGLVRSPFEIVRSVVLRDDQLTVTDTVTNVGGEHLDVMWVSRSPSAPPDRSRHGGAGRLDDRALGPPAGVVRLVRRPAALAAGDGQSGMVNLRGVGREGGPESRLAYLSDFTEAAIRVRRPRRTSPSSWPGTAVWPTPGTPWRPARARASRRTAAARSSRSPPAPAGRHRPARCATMSSTLLRIHPKGSRTAHLAVRVTGL